MTSIFRYVAVIRPAVPNGLHPAVRAILHVTKLSELKSQTVKNIGMTRWQRLPGVAASVTAVLRD